MALFRRATVTPRPHLTTFDYPAPYIATYIPRSIGDLTGGIGALVGLSDDEYHPVRLANAGRNAARRRVYSPVCPPLGTGNLLRFWARSYSATTPHILTCCGG